MPVMFSLTFSQLLGPLNPQDLAIEGTVTLQSFHSLIRSVFFSSNDWLSRFTWRQYKKQHPNYIEQHRAQRVCSLLWPIWNHCPCPRAKHQPNYWTAGGPLAKHKRGQGFLAGGIIVQYLKVLYSPMPSVVYYCTQRYWWMTFLPVAEHLVIIAINYFHCSIQQRTTWNPQYVSIHHTEATNRDKVPQNPRVNGSV